MKLFFRNYGSGSPLIILHGLYGSSDNWASIAKNVGNTFSVILPDQRNHGLSPWSDIHDYPSMSDDIHELARTLNIKKFFLAGHSMGGRTALAFALKWPEMIEGLLIADISPFCLHRNADFLEENTKILKTIASIDLSKIKSRAEVDLLLQETIRDIPTRTFIMKNLRRISDNSFAWKINTGTLLNCLEDIAAEVIDHNHITKSITGFPVIFLKGEYSEEISKEDIPYIKELFPNAEIITIHKSGHRLHVDNPKEVTDALLGLHDSTNRQNRPFIKTDQT